MARREYMLPAAVYARAGTCNFTCYRARQHDLMLARPRNITARATAFTSSDKHDDTTKLDSLKCYNVLLSATTFAIETVFKT
jgi:hypothetical protein